MSGACGAHQFVSDPPQDYICQICMKVLQEPHVTECCGQHFCKGCLEKWFEKNHGDKVCPHCKEADIVHILYKPLQRKINKLEIHCSNRELGCEVIMKVEDIDFHFSPTNLSSCDYALIPCPMCGQELLRMVMGHHIFGDCPKREKTCTHCNLAMSSDMLDGHYEVCEEMKVSCPRKCGKEMRRGDLKIHEDACPYMPVKCPFSDAGCQVELTRKEVEQHMEKSTTAHLMCLATGYSSLKIQHAQLKASNDRLKADVDSLKAENKMLKGEGSASKKAFVAFKSQMAKEIVQVKDILEKPDSKIAKSLECIESSLRGYEIESAADEIMFSVPSSAETWQSPSFGVCCYAMCLVVKSDSVELLLLKGAADGKLRWPADLKQSITLAFYSSCVPQGRVGSYVGPHLKTLSPAGKAVISFEHLLISWRDQKSIEEVKFSNYYRPLYIGVRLEKQDVEAIPVAVLDPPSIGHSGSDCRTTSDCRTSRSYKKGHKKVCLI